MPDECLHLIFSAMTPGDRCLASMTCKKWRRLLDAERTVDGRACLAAFGFDACARLGCPRSPCVCDVLAGAGPACDEDLIRAADAGCPVGPAVAAEAAVRGSMDMLMWAWRRGAALDASVGSRLARAPPNVVRWLMLQGCPAESGLADMVAADNADSVAVVADCRRLGPGVWMRMWEMAKSAGAWKTHRYIGETFRLS